MLALPLEGKIHRYENVRKSSKHFLLCQEWTKIWVLYFTFTMSSTVHLLLLFKSETACLKVSVNVWVFLGKGFVSPFIVHRKNHTGKGWGIIYKILSVYKAVSHWLQLILTNPNQTKSVVNIIYQKYRNGDFNI